MVIKYSTSPMKGRRIHSSEGRLWWFINYAIYSSIRRKEGGIHDTKVKIPNQLLMDGFGSRIFPRSSDVCQNPEEPEGEDEDVQMERERTANALSFTNFDEVKTHKVISSNDTNICQLKWPVYKSNSQMVLSFSNSYKWGSLLDFTRYSFSHLDEQIKSYVNLLRLL